MIVVQMLLFLFLRVLLNPVERLSALTVNDRISPQGLICKNGFYGWGIIRKGGLLIFARKSAVNQRKYFWN